METRSTMSEDRRDKTAHDPSPEQTVVILGADGFIGTAIRRHLAGTYRLFSVDLRRTTPIAACPGPTISDPDGDAAGEAALRADESIARLDLGSVAQVDELLEALAPRREQIAAVVHLAAHYDFRNRPDERYRRLQEATPRLLAGLDELLAKGTPLLYASSMAAMQPCAPGEKLTPDSPRVGGWAYPAHKRAIEELLESTPMSLSVVELVLAGVYSDLCELVPLFQQIERVARRALEAYFYPGPTDRGLTYVHVDDVARAFGLAIEAYAPGRRDPPEVDRLLVGERGPVTYREIHERASRTFHGSELPLLPMPAPLAKLGAGVFGLVARLRGRRRFLQPWMVQFAGEHFEFDISETTEHLGWEPRHSLDDRLDRILDTAAHHHDWWRQINEARPW
jgi:nucleoside-diphosphate-sugar epimerase